MVHQQPSQLYNSNAFPLIRPSRSQQLIPLLLPLQPLHPLLIHLLRHLLISLLFLLCRSLIPDRLYSSLSHTRQVSSCTMLLPRENPKPTCRSASFSSFISFSLCLTASCTFRASTRFVQDERPAVGRKALLLSCHCLPVSYESSE